jgi:hypothetical protein
MKANTISASVGLSARSILVLTALIIWAGLLGGCASSVITQPLAVHPTQAPAPYLAACASSAAMGQRQALGESFKMLQLTTEDLLIIRPTGPVGRQRVAYAYDGTGDWWAKNGQNRPEWRKIRFHCLVSPQGQVVYSFVKGL